MNEDIDKARLTDTIRAAIRDVPDFPKPGILFRDITPVLGSPDALAASVSLFADAFAEHRPDVVVGIESRGFLFGTPLALKLGAGFVPARKPGKLPCKTRKVSYDLEYGSDAIEMHEDAIPSGARVLVIDDLIATGGTAQATCKLVADLGGTLVGAGVVIELCALEGRRKLGGVELTALLQY